ncbi:MAG: gliding motility-associated C-terminal domain-containing protein, partial [Saprospiraceae bacterium]
MKITKRLSAIANICFLLPAFAALLLFSNKIHAQTLVVNGSAVNLGGSCYQLTPDSANQAGTIFSNGTYSLYAPFNLKARMNFGCNEAGGDGMAFIFTTSNSGVGTNGGGLGYEGLAPSLVVQFDDFQNGSHGDPAEDHIAVMRNGSADHNSSDNLAGPLTLPNLQDCNDHCFDVNWNPSNKKLTVSLDSVTITWQDDIVNNIFGGVSTVYFGFSGASGTAFNGHTICFGPPAIQPMADIEKCPGDSAVLQADPNGLAYSWFPSPGLSAYDIPNPTVTPLVTSIYSVTITFQCGFTQPDEVVYTVLPLPGLGTTSNSPVCEGDTLRLLAGGGDLFEWSGPQGFTSGEQKPIIPHVTPAEAGLYSVTVTGANLCVGVHQLNVAVNDTVQTSESIHICGNETADIFGTPTNVPGVYSMAWPGANGCDSTHVITLTVSDTFQTEEAIVICETETADIFGTPTNEAGNYAMTFQSAGGCDSTHTIHLVVNDTFLIKENRWICYGDSALIFGEYVSQLGEYVKTWPSSQGCDSTRVVTLTVGEDMAVSLVPEHPCPGTETGSIAATVTGGAPGYAYEWSVPSGNDNTLSGLPPGDYSVTVTDANGCFTIASATLVDVPDYAFTYDLTDARCFGEASGAIDIFSSAPALQFSLDGAAFQGVPAFDNLPAGGYTLYVRDEYGCLKTQDFEIGSPDEIYLSLPGEVDIERGDSFLIEAITLDSTLLFQWSPETALSCTDCPSPVTTSLDTILYTLTVTDTTGCQTGDSILVNVELILNVMVPNAFSPNHDGLNDKFYILGKGIEKVELLRVFDRWGEQVYEGSNLEANNPNIGWDGTAKGTDVASDVFVYYGIVRFANGTKKV